MNRRCNSLVFFLAWSLLLLHNCYAQHLGQIPSKLTFNQITEENELPSNYINHVTQDSFGFIWFASATGLIRYDGHEKFKVYSKATHPEIKSDLITCIAVDHFGLIWIGTKLGGVSTFDPQTNSWANYQKDDTNKRSLNHNDVLCILISSDNKVYVGTEGGLNIYSRETNDFDSYEAEKGKPGKLQTRAVLSVFEDNAKRIWVGSWGSGFYLMDDDSSGANFLQLLPNKYEGCKNIWNIEQDRAGNYWLATHLCGAIVISDVEIENFVLSKGRNQPAYNYIPAIENVKNALHDNILFDIFKDRNDNLWFSSPDGLSIIEAKNTEQYTTTSGVIDKDKIIFKQLIQDGPHNNSVTFHDCSHIHQSKDGIIWFSTYNGVLTFDQFKNQFNSYEIKNELIPNSENLHFYKGNILICAGENGLLSFDTKKNKIGPVDPRLKKIIDGKFVSAITSDENNVLYITTHKGIYIIEEGFSNFKYYTPPRETFSLDDFFFGKSIISTNDSTLWSATELGLIKLNTKTGEFREFKKNPGDPKNLTDNSITSIKEDRNGDVWVGTYNGLNRGIINGEDIHFKHYLYDNQDSTSIFSNAITSITCDGDRILFSTENGMGYYDLENESFHRYGTKEENLYVHAMRIINNKIWGTSQSGIFLYDIEKQFVKRFGASDGLENMTFRMGSTATDDQEKIYFANSTGIVTFDPATIAFPKEAPKVFMDEANIINRQGERTVPLFSTDTLELKHDDFYLNLSFIGLNYTDTDNTKLAYQLEGFDNDWIEINSASPVTYTNLDPNVYRFKVRSANLEGIWSEEIKELIIDIRPAFWQTVWFKILATIASILFLLWCFLAYTARVRKENTKLESLNSRLNNEIEAKNRYESELRQSELKLKNINMDLSRSNEELEQFAYVASHDLKEPLRTIGSYMGLIKKKMSDSDNGMFTYLNTVESAVKRMHEQVDNILTFSQVGREKLEIRKVPLTKLCKDIVVGLGKKIDEKRTKIIIEDLPTVDANDEQMGMLFNNLISNAIKFNSSENPIVKVYQSNVSDNMNWHITVEDNGIGIAEEHKNKIFEIFKRLNSSKNFEGTGIGLALCKKIVDLHKGQIILDSIPDQYTKFTITLPKEIKEIQ